MKGFRPAVINQAELFWKSTKFLFCVSEPFIFLAPFPKRDSKCGIFHLVDLLIRKNYFFETIYQKQIFNRRNFSMGSGSNRGQCHVEYRVELLSVRPSVCLSVYPYIHMCVCLYIHMNIYTYIRMSAHLSIRMSIHTSVCLPLDELKLLRVRIRLLRGWFRLLRGWLRLA